MSASTVTVRRAGPADIPTLVELRLAMYRDLDNLGREEAAPELAEAIHDFMDRKLPTGQYVAWVAEADGAIIATASVVLLEKLPSPHNPSGLEAYLMSVYTRPSHRRQGAGERLVREVLAFARAHGITRLSLHASEHGRPLYERLGFRPTLHEMRWEAER